MLHFQIVLGLAVITTTTFSIPALYFHGLFLFFVSIFIIKILYIFQELVTNSNLQVFN